MAPGAAPGAPGEERGPLRSAFGGLTTRGRSFLAAGAAAAVCAYLLGQPDLLRVGALLAALPVLCVLVLHRTRSRIAASRRLAPARVASGAESRVHLRVDNVVRGVPTGLLMLQDRVPYVLGDRPRFLVDRIEPGGHREVSYRVRSELRGRYPLGPLELRLADPFGMVELTRCFDAFDVLTVLPTIEPLPAVALGGQATGHGEGSRRAMAASGDEDIIPREYRHGDDLRRVHWRASAHQGSLMVRREERPMRDHCTVLLDTRRRAYEGSGPGSPFERAVSGAASAVSHLLERGYAVRVLTDTGTLLPGSADGPADPADVGGLLLDALSVVEHSSGRGFAALDQLPGMREQGLLLAFLGSVGENAAAELRRVRQHATGAVAFVAAGQVDPVVERRRLALLRDDGWTAVPHSRDVPLARLWQEAAYRRRGPAGI